MHLRRFPQTSVISLLAMLSIGVTGHPGVAASVPHTVNSTKGYAISIPADWTVQQGTEAPIDLLAVAPDSADDDYRVSVDLAVEPLQEKIPVTAKSYYAAKKQAMQRAMNAFSEVKSGAFSGNGTGWKMVYRASIHGITLQNCRYLFTSSRRGYLITGTATPATFAKYEPIFDRIARSFTLTAAAPAAQAPVKPGAGYYSGLGAVSRQGAHASSTGQPTPHSTPETSGASPTPDTSTPTNHPYTIAIPKDWTHT